MFLAIIAKDLKEAAEELAAGVTSYTIVGISSTVYIADKTLSLIIPLTIAYTVHKLKKNYWESERPFFQNIIHDLIKHFKKK